MRSKHRGSCRRLIQIAGLILMTVGVQTCGERTLTAPDSAVGRRDERWSINSYADAHWVRIPGAEFESLSVDIHGAIDAAMIGVRLEVGGVGADWQADSTTWIHHTAIGTTAARFDPVGSSLPVRVQLVRTLGADPQRPNVAITQLTLRMLTTLLASAPAGSKLTPHRFVTLDSAGFRMGDSTGRQISRWGDLDRSGVVDFADAALAAEAGVGVLDTASVTIGLGDADSSNTVTTRDGLIIARYVAGLINHPYLGQLVGPQVAVVSPGHDVTVSYAGGASIDVSANDIASATQLTIEEVAGDTSIGSDSILGPAFNFTVSAPSSGIAPTTAIGLRRGFRSQLTIISSFAPRASPLAASSGGPSSTLVLPSWNLPAPSPQITPYLQLSTSVTTATSTETIFGYTLPTVTREVTGFAMRTAASLENWAHGAIVKAQAKVWTIVQCQQNIHLSSAIAPASGNYLNVVLIHGIQLTDPSTPGVGGSTFLECDNYAIGSSLDLFWYQVVTRLNQNFPLLGSKLRFHRLVYPTFNVPTLAGQFLAGALVHSSNLVGHPTMLVGHSMGGLVAAEALRNSVGSPVVRVVTFGTPFWGTPLAEPGITDPAKLVLCAASAGLSVVVPGSVLACALGAYILFPTAGLRSLRPTDSFITTTLRAPPQTLFFAFAGDVLPATQTCTFGKFTALTNWLSGLTTGTDGLVPTYSAYRFPSRSDDVPFDCTEHMNFADTQEGLDKTALAVADVAFNAPAALSSVSGNGQTVQPGQPVQLVVSAHNVLDVGVSGETVTFSSSWSQPVQALTDPAGNATVTLSAPSAAGSYSIVVTIAGLPPLTASVTVVAAGSAPELSSLCTIAADGATLTCLPGTPGPGYLGLVLGTYPSTFTSGAFPLCGTAGTYGFNGFIATTVAEHFAVNGAAGCDKSQQGYWIAFFSNTAGPYDSDHVVGYVKVHRDSPGHWGNGPYVPPPAPTRAVHSASAWQGFIDQCTSSVPSFAGYKGYFNGVEIWSTGSGGGNPCFNGDRFADDLDLLAGNPTTAGVLEFYFWPYPNVDFSGNPSVKATWTFDGASWIGSAVPYLPPVPDTLFVRGGGLYGLTASDGQLFFMTGDFPEAGQNLHTITAQGGGFQTLAGFFYGWQFLGAPPLISGGYAYWIVGSTYFEEIKRVPVNGGSIETIATGLAVSTPLLTDGQYLYFATFSGAQGYVNRVPVAGGQVEQIVPYAQSPTALAIGNGRLFYQEPLAGEIMSVPVAGGAPAAVSPGTALPISGVIFHVQGPTLIVAVQQQGSLQGISTVALTGGTLQQRVSGTVVISMIADSSYLYVVESPVTNAIRYRLTDFSKEIIGFSNSLSNIAIDGQYVYWTETFFHPGGGFHSAIMRIPR
jgi:hypothetical protein